MIRFIKAGANAFLKHGIASALHLLKILILVKHRAVLFLLTYNEKFEKDIAKIFKREGKEFLYIWLLRYYSIPIG